MNEAAETSVWTILLPVLVGGVLATIGGAVGPTLSYLFVARSTKIAKTEQRFEDLLSAIYEYDHWLDHRRNQVAYGQEMALAAPPISKAIAIAIIHFPKLLPSIKELDTASQTYTLWMTKAGVKRLEGDIDNMNDGFNAAYTVYAKALRQFERTAAGYAESGFASTSE